MRKDEADVIVYVVVGMIIIFYFSFLMVSSDVIEKQNVICDLQVVSHTYLLEMEKNGNLSDEMEEDLTRTLNEMGFENIVFSNDTKQKKSYGEMMELSFVCTVDGESVEYSKIITSKYIGDN